ncbi:MAG: hypothetical protein J5771_00700 [Bacteroidales bacterium]|nr:hypothetical protein [Bacteroidales bacterium]
MKSLLYISLAAVAAFAISCGKEDKGKSKGKTNGDVVQIPVEAVDLGIECTRPDGTKYTVLWAAYNLSEDGFVSAAEECGDYFAWAETVPHYAKGHSKDNPCTSWREIEGKTMTGYDWASYKWCDGRQNAITKYCSSDDPGYWAGTGTMDYKLELADYDYADDAARKILHGKWRIPTINEWWALIDNCSKEWTTRNGVTGLKLSATDGASIFLPAAGNRNYDAFNGEGVQGTYWTSSLHPQNPNNAYTYVFTGNNPHSSYQARMNGSSIRPVWVSE